MISDTRSKNNIFDRFGVMFAKQNYMALFIPFSFFCINRKSGTIFPSCIISRKAESDSVESSLVIYIFAVFFQYRF